MLSFVSGRYAYHFLPNRCTKNTCFNNEPFCDFPTPVIHELHDSYNKEPLWDFRFSQLVDDYYILEYHTVQFDWQINVSWVKMEALCSSETFASLHGVISHNTENIQKTIVNLNMTKSIGLRRGQGLRSLCEEGTDFLYIIYMNFKLHRPRHDSGS